MRMVILGLLLVACVQAHGQTTTQDVMRQCRVSSETWSVSVSSLTPLVVWAGSTTIAGVRYQKSVIEIQNQGSVNILFNHEGTAPLLAGKGRIISSGQTYINDVYSGFYYLRAANGPANGTVAIAIYYYR